MKPSSRRSSAPNQRRPKRRSSNAAPRLVVGLGNPGKEYAATRHNAGYMVVEEVARRYGVSKWKKKDGAEQALDSTRRVVFVKPTSFMNLSGAPVRLISSWYRTPPAEILVVVDEMDLPFGTLRMRPFGGHGGHNGLRSIIATIGEGYPRLRVGVGRPKGEDAIDHVLAPFDAGEKQRWRSIVDAAADGVELWLNQGLDSAMNFSNTWEEPKT
ncbi:MAG: aminoacyl-tRNA hydrolase [Candidatus Eremiobacteraeota bacterium]|nr:aminoacyl-tRNA hydrolase [Candidatus Eremiobacteraeota bacterium]